MATSAITSSIFHEIQSYQQRGRADVRELANALKTGNLDAARQAFNDLAKLGSNAPGGNAPASSANPQVVQAFQAIGQALQSGDLAGAQSAFAALQSAVKNNGNSNAQPSSPAVIVNIGQSGAAAGTESIHQQLQDFRNARKSGVAQLGTALQSGDLNAAQQAYSALVALGQNGPSKNGAVFQRSDRAQAFAAIGQALQSGDLAGAQQAFANLQTALHTPGTQFTQPAPTPGPVPEVIINLGGGGATGSGPVPEVVINIDNQGTPITPSATAGGAPPTNPELVVNIASGNGSGANTAEEIQINFGGNNNSNGQLTIDLSPLHGAQSGEQVKIDFTQGSNKNELIVNLFNNNANNPTSGSSLSVQA